MPSIPVTACTNVTEYMRRRFPRIGKTPDSLSIYTLPPAPRELRDLTSQPLNPTTDEALKR